MLFIRRTVQLLYSRKEAQEEKTLQHLLKQQRTKVDEIKKKTNYYSTRDLLSKHDEPTPLNTPHPSQGFARDITPRRDRSNGTNPGLPTLGLNALSCVHASSSIHATNNPDSASPFLATPTRKQWYDKLAGALLGEDDQAPPSSRYALICEKCFKHKGLLPEAMWEDAHNMNASARSKHEARRFVSPIAASVNGAPSSPRTPSPMQKSAPSSAVSSPAASAPQSGVDGSLDIVEEKSASRDR
ncbi:hypothetical protein BDN71DRAFT_1512616 [Pleurotus eryngii]|uniref:Endoplasmic reticulum junction formation protein lunapark n=1 Tax=Pleurotus eryngii TaxID=5323 RepID=A0A9P5ZKF5_PLEER|nr:hypothetical protein BDN71DRAFT_1512616 [Pleurotus eryngii]